MYIFVFKYLNTSFAAIPRERVRKIFRRLFTEPLLPLREARRFLLRLPSIPFDSLECKSWFFFFFFSLHSSFFFLLFLSLFLSLLPFSSREEDFIEPRHFLRVISYCHGSSCRTIKRWTERNGETPFSFSRAKRREEGGGREREEKKVIKRIGEKFASSSDNTRFRQPTVDYFYARTQLFIVQRIIRSIRPLRHSHYEN